MPTSLFPFQGITAAGIGETPGKAGIIPERVVVKPNGHQYAVRLLSLASGALNFPAMMPFVNHINFSNGAYNVSDVELQLSHLSGSLQQAPGALHGVIHHNHNLLAAGGDSTVPPFQVALAHAFIERGASFYFSHGRPNLLGIEIYQNRPILYGLGNLFFQTLPGFSHYSNHTFEVMDLNHKFISNVFSSLFGWEFLIFPRRHL